jgi:hypothetical protein
LTNLYDSDPVSHQLVNQAILVLERNGPAEGRPLVDTITASRIANMKELRPPSAGRSEIRILAIPRAEQFYEDYLAERRKEMGQ